MTIRPKVMAKRLKLAKKLAKRNGGKLPNPWKMIQQGQSGLYRYISRHPKEFEHFEVEDAVKKESKLFARSTEELKEKLRGKFNVAIRKEHIKKARQLARKNDGVLPDISWLMQHGYTRLASYMKTYPYVFIFDEKPKNGITNKT